jgi:hypothetical protein
MGLPLWPDIFALSRGNPDAKKHDILLNLWPRIRQNRSKSTVQPAVFAARKENLISIYYGQRRKYPRIYAIMLLDTPHATYPELLSTIINKPRSCDLGCELRLRSETNNFRNRNFTVRNILFSVT